MWVVRSIEMMIDDGCLTGSAGTGRDGLWVVGVMSELISGIRVLSLLEELFAQ